MKRAVDRYVDSLLRRRSPRPFAPSEDDLALTRTAIALAAAGPDADGPGEAFVEDLRRRLGERQAAAEAAAPRTATGTAATPPTDESARHALPPQPIRAVPVRRRFLQATALTAGAAAVGATADHLLTRSPAGSSSGPGNEAELTPVHGVWQTVAADADLSEGAVLPFSLDSVVGFIQRSSGRVQAVSGICTHQGCRLNLDTPADVLVCPCHGATFSVSGQPLTYPGSTYTAPALPRLPVRVQQGNIQIYAPAPPPGSTPESTPPATASTT